MLTERDRKWSSATGAAPATLPAGTGTRPGAHAGRGFDEGFGTTEREDRWWLKPAIQALGLTLLGIYATWAAFQGNHYLYDLNGRDYLSPFYSPLFLTQWWPLSPALLILWIPLGFRATCYYYRKAYYRSFFADPAACAVGELKSKGYRGENAFPFILQNLHRYFFYLALVILAILWYDVYRGFRIGGGFGIGGGSIVLLVNTTFLSLYTFSCHSLRHLIGGSIDCFSCAVAGGPRHRAWGVVSVLNEHHMAWAWWSLFAVCFADFYVRMCSMGVIQDPLFFPRALSTVAGLP